ncbi:MAG: insulinase family protein [Pseudomonadota bacterium]
MKAILLMPVALTLCLLALRTVIAAPVTIETSPNDKRTYAYHELSNGLRAILISEPDATVSAASLDVNTGSGDDPKTHPGLAHFLEHMLFLGTDRFPEAGGYQTFIARNGGSQNAYTSYDHTNYHFDIESTALRPALERFSRFFVAPLLAAEYVERERQVVEAEFRSHLKSDARRSYSAFKQSLHPDHPLRKFAVGTAATLADRDGSPVRAALVEFYRTHYRAANMTLVVLGRERIDALRSMVDELFADVPHGAAPARPALPPLFAPGSLPRRLDIVPEREYRTVSLTFPMPDMLAHYRAKPSGYVAHLLGHEGPGSLLSWLRREGLANSLSAGSGLAHPGFSSFRVRVGLTVKGLAQLETVIGRVFTKLDLIRAEGPQRWRFDEVASMNRLAFKFQEPAAAGALAQGLAHALHVYPAADVIRAGYAMDEFSPVLIDDVLGRLTPQNMLMTVTAPELEATEVTPYFAARYRLTPLDTAGIERIRELPAPSIALARPNDFLPEQVEVLRDASGVPPKRLLQSDGLTLWHQQDTSFAVPFASYFVALRTPSVNASVRTQMMTALLIGMLNEQLDETTYPAAVAGMGARLYQHARGMSLRLNGYSDKQGQLARAVLGAIRNPEWDEGRYQRVRARLVRQLQNSRLRAPYSQAMGALSTLLLKPRWPIRLRRAALDSIDLDALRRFSSRWLAEVEVEVLAHGNVSAATALAHTDIVRETLAGAQRDVEVPEVQALRLERPLAATVFHSVDHDDNAVAIYYQGRGQTLRERAATALLAQLLSTDYYTELRTNQQLGYVVFASAMPLADVAGLVLAVQSPSHAGDDLLARSDRFVNTYAAMLASVSEADFARVRDSLRERFLEADKTLGERSGRYWSEIARGVLSFDERERIAHELGALTLADVRAQFRTLIASSERSRLVAFAGRAEPATVAGHEAVTDRSVFRAAREFFAPRPR